MSIMTHIIGQTVPAAKQLTSRLRTVARMLLALGIILILLGNAVLAATLTRSQTSGPRPSERSSPSVAALGQDIYLFGGVFDNFAAGKNLFHNDLYRFVTADKRWERVETEGERPEPRAFAGTAPDSEKRRFFIFGGSKYGPKFQDYVAYDDLWVYSAPENTWQKIMPGNEGPSGRSGASLWTEGNSLYLFGGVSNRMKTRNDLWVLDLKNREWKQLIPNDAKGSPPPRHEAVSGSGFQDGKLMIYGGESIEPETGKFGILSDTWEYDISKKEWKQVATEPPIRPAPPRNYSAAAGLGGGLYVHGGDIPQGTTGCGAPFPQNVTSGIWKYDPKSQVWSEVKATGDAPLRLKRHRGAEAGGRLYLFTGYDFQCEDGKGPGQIWNQDVFVIEP